MKFQECLEYIDNIPKEQCKNIRNIEIILPNIFPKVIRTKVTFAFYGIHPVKKMFLWDRYENTAYVTISDMLSNEWQVNIEYCPKYETIAIKDNNDK